MAVGKEIRTKIKSIQNTQKITRAMEMVAASKMRKAQERMRASRPYAEKMRNVIGHLANAHPEYKHPFLVERDVKRVGFIVVSTDRGLCGGLMGVALLCGSLGCDTGSERAALDEARYQDQSPRETEAAGRDASGDTGQASP